MRPMRKQSTQDARLYTSKQMGDACEMLVAAELTLAGVPAMKVPDNWPCYDVIAQPPDGGPPQRVSVKSRTFKRGGSTFVVYDAKDQFDRLAIVLLRGADQAGRPIFLIPRREADARAKHDSPTSKTQTKGTGDRIRWQKFCRSSRTISVCRSLERSQRPER
jgi:hypothetical protein